MKSSFTRMVSGLASATLHRILRWGLITLPVCIAISRFSSHPTRPPAAYSSGCSTAHGGVRSLCGLRGKNQAKSTHGRSITCLLTVDENMAGGNAPFPPGQRSHVRVQERRSPGTAGTRGSSFPATTTSMSGRSGWRRSVSRIGITREGACADTRARDRS